EAISTVRRIEIATATCCGLAMTTGEISSFESKHLRTKNRLPEYLVAPGQCAVQGREFKIDFGCYGCIKLALNPDSINCGAKVLL
ncbi:MAG TPA: hypothetical protein VMX36_06225, partial [Sedimentisphaerales bacterium]|nr:hypothetical protein [Sedimentisphaerales bacterium]